jgi:NADH-quinone oxidoreductase subunit D
VELGAVGPVLRASGPDYDVRRDFPYLQYEKIEFPVRTSELCDVLGRTLVRVQEVIDACDIVTQCLDLMPEGEIAERFPRRVPEGESTVRVEAQRGELIYYVRSNGTDVPDRVKIRTPTLANLPASLEMVTGGYIADIPISFASIDPCFSCTDRMVVLDDVSSGDTTTMSWPELVKLSRDR